MNKPISNGIEGVNRLIHIRQMPRTITELDLKNLFDNCGKISSCRFVDEERLEAPLVVSSSNILIYYVAPSRHLLNLIPRIH